MLSKVVVVSSSLESLYSELIIFEKLSFWREKYEDHMLFYEKRLLSKE